MKYLIVDDNAGMREMIRSVVCRENDMVFECTHGIEAVIEYQKQHPDYVLMDTHLKEMDGITATSLIKSFDPAAKVIIITDYGTKSYRFAAERAGAHALVAKENLAELQEYIIH